VKRTILLWLTWGRDPTELERRVQVWRQFAPSAPSDDVLARERSLCAFVGTPDEVIERLRSYAEVGMQEIIVQWWNPEDIEGLRLLSGEIVPYVQAHD
jgi:alkanesulfonate monooxygenase SsuD/methylene tetrahydromethanopterin reductase-like flavin-dependent oxidoreductase (luciferase family)